MQLLETNSQHIYINDCQETSFLHMATVKGTFCMRDFECHIVVSICSSCAPTAVRGICYFNVKSIIFKTGKIQRASHNGCVQEMKSPASKCWRLYEKHRVLKDDKICGPTGTWAPFVFNSIYNPNLSRYQQSCKFQGKRKLQHLLPSTCEEVRKLAQDCKTRRGEGWWSCSPSS